MAAGGTANDPQQHARQRRAVSRCVMLAVAPSDERTVALERRRLRCDRPVPACATMPRWVTNPLTTPPCEALRLPPNCVTARRGKKAKRCQKST
jgi:hypothetical protein